MRTIERYLAHRIDLLHDQLIAAGIVPLKPPLSSGTYLRLVVDDAVSDGQVNAVLAAHDPAALRPAEQLDTSERTQAQAALSQLQAYIDNAAPTAGDTVAVTKLLCRIAKIVIRRLMGLS